MLDSVCRANFSNQPSGVNNFLNKVSGKPVPPYLPSGDPSGSRSGLTPILPRFLASCVPFLSRPNRFAGRHEFREFSTQISRIFTNEKPMEPPLVFLSRLTVR